MMPLADAMSPAVWGAGMQGFRWAGLVAVAVLTGAVAYRHADRSPPSGRPAPPLELAALPSVAQEPVPPPPTVDDARLNEARLQDAASASAVPEPAQAAGPQPEGRTASVTGETRSVTAEPVPVALATAAVLAEPATPAGKTPDLSYLHFYAYSEVPPPTKPADTVLEAMKGIPPGTPLDEIKRVSDLLKLDFTFMKTVAKIESGFDPKQRTGSYIGLFQLSEKEFGMYGSGDILDARDNTVAAAIKFMTENVMFEMFTHRMPTFNDIYLIHQQGVEGAVEHLSHPRRLAWRSMCETYEGKEKGEKWCKRAIWGNTLPALKRVWKNVNRVTSADFVGMWRQRVAEFYVQYSKSAAK
jgi:hypothetical protein